MPFELVTIDEELCEFGVVSSLASSLTAEKKLDVCHCRFLDENVELNREKGPFLPHCPLSSIGAAFPLVSSL